MVKQRPFNALITARWRFQWAHKRATTERFKAGGDITNELRAPYRLGNRRVCGRSRGLGPVGCRSQAARTPRATGARTIERSEKRLLR